jgi:formylglycine-generating enzyme required for sulfatase activity
MAAAIGLSETFTNSAGIKMIRVEKGEIKELETHEEGEFKEILITEAYALAEMETTLGQWLTLMKENPNRTRGNDETARASELPVGGVSYEAAEEFCRKLTEREKLSGMLPTGYIYRLPTEEMWEYACRAGTKGDFSLPVKRIANHFWVGKDEVELMTAKQLEPNPWGFRHMHGNLLEWCRPGVDRIGKQGDSPQGVIAYPLRGGTVSFDAGGCRSGIRKFLPSEGHPKYSFRVALVKESAE